MERMADIGLIKTTYQTDAIGQQLEGEEVTRTLLATLHGISRQEWSMAAQTGLNPEGMAFLRDSADYEGEELPADYICPLCKHGAADFEPIE